MTSDYPLFYKNPDARSAIDIALDLNQINSINLMLKHIVKYQNKAVWSHLFKYNLIDLIQKSVSVTDLFESQILNMPIEYSGEWPALSPDK